MNNQQQYDALVKMMGMARAITALCDDKKTREDAWMVREILIESAKGLGVRGKQFDKDSIAAYFEYVKENELG